MKVDRGRHNYKTAFWMVDNEKLRGVELLVTGPENKELGMENR